MLGSAIIKNVIEATNKPHLLEKLEDLQKRFMLFSSNLCYTLKGFLPTDPIQSFRQAGIM